MKTEENVYHVVYNGKSYIINRHYGKLPNGEPSRGMWGVFCIETGEMIDWNQFRNDLLDRYRVVT